MTYLLPFLMALCPPHTICLDGSLPPYPNAPEAYFEYHLEVPKLEAPSSECAAKQAHLDLLNAHISALEIVHRDDQEKLAATVRQFERKRSGMIAGMTISATIIAALISVLATK